MPKAPEGKFQLSNLILQPRSPEVGEAAELQVRRILGELKGFDYLDKDAQPIWNTITGAKFIHRLFSSLQVFLGAVAVVTLILGGVGVMNIMLLSVGERTHEIGICKAVGATGLAIFLQVLIESVVIALLDMQSASIGDERLEKTLHEIRNSIYSMALAPYKLFR